VWVTQPEKRLLGFSAFIWVDKLSASAVLSAPTIKYSGSAETGFQIQSSIKHFSSKTHSTRTHRCTRHIMLILKHDRHVLCHRYPSVYGIARFPKFKWLLAKFPAPPAWPHSVTLSKERGMTPALLLQHDVMML